MFADRERKQNKSTEGCSKLKKSGNKTSSGEIGLDIRTHASPKVGQYQASSVGMPHPLQMF